LLLNSDNIESDGLGDWSALSDSDDITFIDTEAWGAMGSNVFMSLLESVVFTDVVEIVASKNNGVLHLVRDAHSLEDSASNRHISGEWALFINILTINSLLWGLESETNILVVSNSLLGLSSQKRILFKVNLINLNMAEQTERAFQRQEHVFLNKKSLLATKTKKGVGYYKNVGLGFKTPKEAIDGQYVDKKCPFTGNVSIRGRILKGMCISNKMKNTVILRRDYLHYVSKYNRFEKRHKNVAAHCSPCFRVNEGDIVTVGQCRPVSKTVRYNVLRVEKKHIEGNPRKTFCMF
jgi:small subunit ribosomal protein S11e